MSTPIRFGSYVVALAIAMSRAALSATFAESGDAMSLLPGQAALGAGSLEEITGTLATSSDVDAFRIRINVSSLFHAETFSPLDSQLFLFDVNGFGIAANDDMSESLDAGLPAGNGLYVSLAPGEYILAISSYDVDPLFNGALIFPSPTKGMIGVVGATGPGSAGSVDAWTGNGLLSGNYRIELTGVTFVPEPSTATLVICGLAALAKNRSRRLP